MSKEAMKLALEAYCKTLHPLWNTGISRTEAEGFFNAGFKAAEAISKQEQGEPVAWRWRVGNSGWQLEDIQPRSPTAQPLYTTPQQRTWVGLTDEEMQQVFVANSVMVDNGNAYMVAGLRAINIGQAIEAKLKEKNGA